MYWAAKIVAVITRCDRYFPDYTWSRSWVVNCFRVYESVCGRRVGIRPEQYVNPRTGLVLSYTWENYFATWEGIIRAALRQQFGFKVVYIPQLQVAGMRRGGYSPFRFAIAFDAVVIKSTGAATTWTHTVTGSNPYLLMNSNANSGTTNTITGVTYNSVSMSDIMGGQDGGNHFWNEIYAQGNPATGGNTISISGTVGFYQGSISYSGCQSVDAPDNKNTASHGAANTSSPFNISLTPSADKCWVVSWFNTSNSAAVAGTSTTARTTGGDGFEGFFDNNSAISPAASTQLQITFSTANAVGANMVSIAPAAAAVASNPAIVSNLLFN